VCANLRGSGVSLSAGCENDGYLADVAARGVVARHVGLQLSPLFQLPDAGVDKVQAVFGDQRPDRVPVALLLAEGTVRVEVRLALDRGVDGREASPMVETGVVDDFQQLVEGT
jgi:hypothetical protein